MSILPAFRFGESSAAMSAIGAATVVSGSPNINAACSTLANRTNSFGSSIYCNLIPQYWLSSMAWISQNVGPTGPRVLAWWDYGDWINWFGKSKAVLRGDNAKRSKTMPSPHNTSSGQNTTQPRRRWKPHERQPDQSMCCSTRTS